MLELYVHYRSNRADIVINVSLATLPKLKSCRLRNVSVRS